MVKLLAVFAAALVLAYISEMNTRAALASGRRYSIWGDWAYLALAILLSLFAGLRTSYNDTGNYTSAFKSAATLPEFLSDPENLNPFKNPLFYLFQSTLRSVTSDPQWLVLISATITQCCFLRFFKRYSQHFFFSIFIYFTLGTLVFTLAAIKQNLGMAIVTLAFPYLEKKKWGAYYALVLVAMLIHTYSIAFAFLPLFVARPWKMFTFLFITAMVAVMLNFEEVITSFMEQANDLGKTLADYEVFDNATVNLFRVGVYAVTPLFSLLFQKWIFANSKERDHIMIHMSIISLAFMSMGTQSGANMFARMAMYFDLGTICCLPKILDKTFEERSYRLVTTVAAVCFFGYFVYANTVAVSFDREYQAISLWTFLTKLL